jgi:hypothetical protein
LGVLVKSLKGQVRQDILALFQIGGFSFRHLNRERRGQIELLPQVIDNVRRQIVDVM